LIWLIYPGVMAIFASAVGSIYLLASLGAMRDYRFAVWISFAFSVATAILAMLSVVVFVQNGFDFLSGSFAQQDGIYLPPYIFLTILVGAVLVVGLQLLYWGRVLRGGGVSETD
tara:strand:- start:179 stop:520 length:342 start_codon:yes stop_codon:yes gene_type:complete